MRGKVGTWVNSQWKYQATPGQFSVAINMPGFSGMTAMQLVREGRADEVLDYIDAVDAGVHA